MLTEFQIIARNYELAGRASSNLKKALIMLNVSRKNLKRICSASYEAEINIVIHSVGGFMTYAFYGDYVELNFYDDGPGIVDIDLAMTEGYSTANEVDHMNGFGAGMGLSNIKKSSDMMELKSSPEGTHLRLLFFLEEYDASN